MKQVYFLRILNTHYNFSTYRVGDQILSVNDTSFIGKPLPECEKLLKSLPKGQVKFVVMAPPKDVTRGSKSSMYTGVSVSHSGRQLVTEEGVVKVELYCYGKNSLGIEIEGGTDTPLQYVYISRIIPGSPAFESGVFRKGDQLVMVGEECMIGLTHREALQVINKAKEMVEVVAQRKESPRQTRKPDPGPLGSDSKKESLEQTSKPIAPAPNLTSSDSKKESLGPVNKPDIPTSPVPVLDSKKESPELMPKPSAPASPVPDLTSSDSKKELSIQTNEPSVPTSPLPEPLDSDSKKDSPEQTHMPNVPTAPITDLTSSDSEKESPKETEKPSVPISPIPVLVSSDSKADADPGTKTSDSKTDKVPETKPSKPQYRSTKSVSELQARESSLTGSDTKLSDNRYSSLERARDRRYLTSPPHATSHTKAYSASDLRRSREDVGGTLNVVPEETLTIELHRSASEKMGLAITGGSDNPRLPEVHVSNHNHIIMPCTLP